MSVTIREGVSDIFFNKLKKGLFCRSVHYYRFKAFREFLLLSMYNSSDVRGEVKFKHVVFESPPYFAVEQHVILNDEHGDYDLGVALLRYPDQCFAVVLSPMKFEEWLTPLQTRVIINDLFGVDNESGYVLLLGDLRAYLRCPIPIGDVDEIRPDILGEWLKRHGYFNEYMAVAGRIPWVLSRAVGVTPFVIRQVVDRLGFWNIYHGIVNELSSDIRFSFHGYHISFKGVRMRRNTFWTIDPVIRVEHRRLGRREVSFEGEYVLSFHVSP